MDASRRGRHAALPQAQAGCRVACPAAAPLSGRSADTSQDRLADSPQRHAVCGHGHNECFSVNRPLVWNSLPAELRSFDISLDVFKARLKTFLFNC